jgi:hypothetical protein
MMAVAVAYTLFVHGIKVTDGYTAALAIKPFAGKVAFCFLPSVFLPPQFWD